MSLWALEKRAEKDGYQVVAGVDEVGRGPLAGPVVAAAVVLPGVECFRVAGVRDSKTVPPRERDRLYDAIYQDALAVGIGIVDPVEIDRINILRASLLAMRWAVDSLSPLPDFLLVDGNQAIPTSISQQTVVKGDARSISIAAASIVAKVTRDRLMERYADEFPEFGFSQHKGYGTAQHLRAIRENGCCPIHRKSFNKPKGPAQTALDFGESGEDAP
ncbi:MAG: ribonuclease HII [Proteobacteria bacterium]|nr:ribonuclease HII [Pseudomonadota bacterium]